MGSDPQSHLEIMHRIEHQECRSTESDLKLRLRGSCEDTMIGFAVLAEVIEKQRDENRTLQSEQAEYEELLEFWDGDNTEMIRLINLTEQLRDVIEAAADDITKVDQTGYYHKIVTSLQDAVKGVK